MAESLDQCVAATEVIIVKNNLNFVKKSIEYIKLANYTDNCLKDTEKEQVNLLFKASDFERLSKKIGHSFGRNSIS